MTEQNTSGAVVALPSIGDSAVLAEILMYTGRDAIAVMLNEQGDPNDFSRIVFGVASIFMGHTDSLELPEGTVDATVYSVKKDGSDYRVVFYLDVYYKAFCESRAEDMSIVTSDNEGLIVYNKCIVEKDGNKGVYVKDKNGAYIFTRVKMLGVPDTEAVGKTVRLGNDDYTVIGVLETSTFYDDEGNQVYTVDVYDEVLKHPAGALKEDQKKENSENGG